MAITNDDLNANIRSLGVLIETVVDQNKVLLEAVSDMQTQLADVPKRDEFDALRADVKTIRAAVTDTSQQVHDHERRITHLEARA